MVEDKIMKFRDDVRRIGDVIPCPSGLPSHGQCELCNGHRTIVVTGIFGTSYTSRATGPTTPRRGWKAAVARLLWCSRGRHLEEQGGWCIYCSRMVSAK